MRIQTIKGNQHEKNDHGPPFGGAADTARACGLLQGRRRDLGPPGHVGYNVGGSAAVRGQELRRAGNPRHRQKQPYIRRDAVCGGRGAFQQPDQRRGSHPQQSHRGHLRHQNPLHGRRLADGDRAPADYGRAVRIRHHLRLGQQYAADGERKVLLVARRSAELERVLLRPACQRQPG